MSLFWLALLICGSYQTPVGAAEPAGETCTTLVVWVKTGCPHCAAAETYLHQLVERRPKLAVDIRNISDDRRARQSLQAVFRKYGIERPGVPTFLACGEVLVGFENAQTSGARIENMLDLAAPRSPPPSAGDGERFTVDLPFFGRVNPATTGLPLFTIALGLVDGFNPCAMWLLLLLLSILVNLRDRVRIALVAGIFVLTSGVVYFAFMAAWFNAFLVIGYSRLLQVVIACIALLIGTIHIKDFVSPHRGVSLSIPENAKAGLYQRVGRVVRAENLPAALVATIMLAIAANLVELLCTAGLPALYTQVLSYYAITGTTGYAYLALYNLAYIFDDGLVTLIAVITLSKRKLKTTEGRLLKLLSGVVISGLGILLLLAPEWLSPEL